MTEKASMEPELGSEIRQWALQRIAWIFSIPAESLQSQWIFGVELKSSFRSDFRRNEYDHLSDDIHDVADRATQRLFAEGTLVIRSVGDYCQLMVNQAKANPSLVRGVLLERDDRK